MKDFQILPDFKSFQAPAKINLFLHIIGQRKDGYHLLQSAFLLLPFHYTIHLKPGNDGVIRRVKDVANVPEQQDLCIRAAKLLQQHTGCTKGVDIVVDKHIPMGGGLGGGSSDAATVLLALNRLWDLHLTRTELQDLSLQLGADVPFFIFGQNAWVEGIGEQLQPLPLEPAYYVVLTPPIHVSTAQVFASFELTRNTIPTTIAAFSSLLSGSLLSRTGNLVSGESFKNDLEPVVCRQYPAVAHCLEWLNQFSQARMSGSGASVFAEFENQAQAKSVFDKVSGEKKLQQTASFMARGLDQHPHYSFAD